MISAHFWNKNLPPHLDCFAALPDKNFTVNMLIPDIFYTEYLICSVTWNSHICCARNDCLSHEHMFYATGQ